MSNWRELGEVPDSDEEDGFDSREFEPVAATPTATETAAEAVQPNDNSIWDFPGSQEDQVERPRQPREMTVLVPPPTFDPPSSSPLSSAPSEQDLPPLAQLLPMNDHVGHLGSCELGGTSQPDPPRNQSSQRDSNDRKTGPPVPARRAKTRTGNRTPPQSQGLVRGAGDGDYEATHAAVRYQRSLRPRKPIQEHPYLLENARYSSVLRKHGVKPLSMAIEAERRKGEDTLLDHEFEDDSQESAQRGDRLEESQTDELGRIWGHLDEFDFSSSSPPKTSPLNDNSRISSLVSSQGNTDDTSVLDQDLPALEELLSRPPRLISKRAAKRQATPPRSLTRKRARMRVLGRDPVEPDADLTGTANSLDLRPSLSYHSPSLSQAAKPQTQKSPPAAFPSRSLLSKALLPPADLFINISSDDEGERQRAPISPGTQCASASESDSGSDSEDIAKTMGRCLRGVLPASWLRLDQQSSRNKAQEDKTRRQRQRNLERETRRGVAKLRPALPSSATAQLLFDDSDDEGEASSPSETTNAYFHSQTKRMLDPDPGPSVSRQTVSDDAESVVEDDYLDPMLTRRTRQRRQLMFSKSISRDRKRPKAFKDSAKPQHQKQPQQSKITGHLQKFQGSSLSRDFRSNGRDDDIRAWRKSKGSGGKHAERTSPRMPCPPCLSILDTIQPNAPRFLKVAARAAKKRRDQGRAGPRRKTIRLATRQDHIDAMSVLQDWRAGLIPQRRSVTAASNVAQEPQRPLPLAKGSGNRQKPNPSHKSSTTTARKLVKHINNGGSISYRPHEASNNSPTKRPTLPDNGRVPTHISSARPAQLEVDETDQAMSAAFHARKRRLDRIYRKHRLMIPLAAPAADSSRETNVPSETSAPFSDTRLEPFAYTAEPQEQPPRKTPLRKRFRPRCVDIEAPQYRHANDPLPVQFPPEPEPIQVDCQGGKLLGLGPYGTNYTHHFETFPLDAHVYFHESTLMGSGMIETCSKDNFREKLLGIRPHMSLNLGSQFLRWGPWNSQVSSELGIALDFIAEQIEAIGPEGNCSGFSKSVDAAMLILSYVKDSVIFSDDGNAKSFAARVHECLSCFNERISPQVRQIVQGPEAKRDLALKVYDRLLLAVLVVLKLCRAQSPLMTEQYQIEELLKSVAETLLYILSGLGASEVRRTYEHLDVLRFRERGLRDDTPVIHSWVVLMKVLDMAHIPRASFWELAQAVIASSQVISSVDARALESSWRTMFTLLPLTEFNDAGVITPGRRHDTASDGWIIPLKLLKRVFQLYEENARQAPSFNNYCRALVGRCHYLVQQWGWRRCATVIGVIFDFFGSQDLAHLRNEEVYESPPFLEELARRPRLDIEPSDKCFHVFLKLVALSIRKLREVGGTKDIRNLVARITPNHNRQYLKEQKVHDRDLAALRNHHDLLGTLFWASPPQLRPAVSLIERLVVPASSHKEACLISIRCWNQLARFVVASGEAAKSLKPFLQWRNTFFQQILRQFDSVAHDIQQQALALAKNVSDSFSDDVVNTTISVNKAALMDVLHASVMASLDVMRHAPDLEAATFSLNTLQLQSVLKHFAEAPPGLDWGILRASLATLDSLLCSVDEFKEKEESQQSESQVLNSAQADDALLLVDQEISGLFFSMARCVLSSRRNKESSSMAESESSRCLEQAVTLSARLGTRFSNGGIMRLSDMFRVGRYGLFDGPPHKLDLTQRQYLVLFTSTLLKYGLDDFSDTDFSLSQIWTLSLVKPQNYLEYEIGFAKELARRGKTFVPDSAMGLDTRPDYSTNRDLFEFAISAMRKSVRDAEPSSQKDLLAEHSRTLKLVMEHIKGDLKTMSRDDASAHHAYVTFVQHIISLIKAHGSEIYAVDEFFYHMGEDYSPPVQDPKLQVAGLTSYGLRLREGDGRSGQQLFSFLFNNFKSAMINNKLRDQVVLLRKGMKNGGIADFVLGKMVPVIIRCSCRNSSAFPLLDVYSEALRLLLTRKAVAYELGEEHLHQLVVSVRATVEGMRSMSRSSALLSRAQLHVVRRIMGALNLVWPSIYTMSASGVSSRAWTDMSKCLGSMWQFASTAEAYLCELRERHDSSVQPTRLFAGMRRAHISGPRFDSDVDTFTEKMVQDIEKSWSITGHGTILIQTPETYRGATSPRGMAIPSWDPEEMLDDVYEQTREWCWWWQRVYGVSCVADLPESVVF